MKERLSVNLIKNVSESCRLLFLTNPCEVPFKLQSMSLFVRKTLRISKITLTRLETIKERVR